jgi:hypothetical protein
MAVELLGGGYLQEIDCTVRREDFQGTILLLHYSLQ